MSFLYPLFFLFLLPLFYIYKVTQKTSKLFIALFLMILSLASPVYLSSHKESKIDAREYIVALDISRSMLGEDLKPNRLAYAKRLIVKLFEQNPKDSFTLFAFTTNALILSPPTTDHQLLKIALNSIDINNILTKGTDFQSLLEKISTLKADNKNLIIFSDGGDEISINKALKLAKKNHIIIHAIGIATKKGVILKDHYGKALRDENNHIIISSLNPKLKQLATLSGGIYQNYTNFNPHALKQSKKESINRQRSDIQHLFYIPLMIALLLFLLHFIKLPKRILLAIPFIANYIDAGVLDWYYIKQGVDAYTKGEFQQAVDAFQKIGDKTIASQMDLANSYYQMGKYKKAKSIYESLKTTDPSLKKRILFKLANCEVMVKRYQDAREHYLEALSFGYDKDIIHNLKLIIFKKDPRRDNPAAKSKAQQSKDAPTAKNQTKNHKKSSTKHKNFANSKSSKQSSQKSKSSDSKKSIGDKKLSHPLGYKAYDMINRGYIDEKKPY